MNRIRRRRSRDLSPIEKAWEADAHAKKVHTWEAWAIAADAFEEAHRPDIADRIRLETRSLRKNLPRKELLHVAVRAADQVLSKTYRTPTEKQMQKARSAAFDAIRKADRLAGTPNHRTLKNSYEISVLAERGAALARQLNQRTGSARGSLPRPKWHERIR